jgi:hypothetical protein
MGKFIRRLAVVIVSALAPMAFVALVTPGVSSAACDNGWWWDPVANVCRSLVPLACDNGWWWDPVANVCQPPAVQPPLACDNGWWWDPVANVCQPPLIP